MKKIIICDKVKTYRKENKLTQEEFGEIIVIVSLTNKYINYEINEINRIVFEPFFSQ